MLVAAFGKVDAWRAWRKKTLAWLGNGPFAKTVRRGIPTSEIIAAALCFWRPIAGLISATALFTVLATGVAYLALQHDGDDCGCFGALMPSQIGISLVVRNVIAAAAAAVASTLALRNNVTSISWQHGVTAAFVGALFLAAAEYRRMMQKSNGGFA